MSARPEFVGTIHIFLGPCRGNPIGLYLRKEGDVCSISPTMSPWDSVVGVGETANKAAADFDAKWKAGDVAAELYSGPHWEGGIKPEKPKPPPKQPTTTTAQAPAPPQSEGTMATTAPPTLPADSRSSRVPPPSHEASTSPENDPPSRAPSDSSEASSPQ